MTVTYYGINTAFNSGKGWVPIGDTQIGSFSGNYDGNGKTISGLSINDTSLNDAGLFGYIQNNTISNLKIAEMDITAGSNSSVGGVVGSCFNVSKIENCLVTGKISGGAFSGGVVGNAVNNNTFKNCSFTGPGGTLGSISQSRDAGGIVGYNDSSTVENCYAAVAINTDNGNGGGGIVGYNYSGTIKNSYATGSVTGTIAGGVVMTNDNGTVVNCYSTGTINYSSNSGGGIAGHLNGGTLENCVALNPSVTGASASAGRIIGYNSTVISTLANNYARADMLVNGATVNSTDPTAVKNDVNGEGIASASTYNTVDWWKNVSTWNTTSPAAAWDLDNVWVWNNAKQLPILRNVMGQ